MSIDPRRVSNQRRAADNEAVQTLRDTRRTLLKLVAIIDAQLALYEKVDTERRIVAE